MAHLRPLAIAGMCLLVATGARLAPAAERLTTVAVFPVENLSGGSVPADVVHQFLVDSLSSNGFRVLGNDALEAFMTRHRVRYAAGIDTATAEALRQETGVEGVVIASVELSDDAVPPKVALTARLVSIQASPTVIWADDAGLSGDDAPGWLELGVVHDYETLQARALGRVARSLVGFLKTGDAGPNQKAASKFRPKTMYRGRAVESGKNYSVAVLPFVNLSNRRNAGEIVASLFTRHLSSVPQFRVVDTGATRHELLNARVIMDGGISLGDAETVASLVDADFVLAGRVLSYDDYQGPVGTTHVEFSTVLIEKGSRRVVFSARSDNHGTDGVLGFERGMSRTAHAMATQMVRLVTKAIAGEAR